MDQGMCAALNQKRVLAAADPLKPIQKVSDELDLKIHDPLEAHVGDRGALMAGARRSQGHNLDLRRISVSHADAQE
jgi:hypothetical protein